MVQISERRLTLWAGHSLQSPQSCAPSTLSLDSGVFSARAEEAPSHVCHVENSGLLVPYSLRLVPGSCEGLAGGWTGRAGRLGGEARHLCCKAIGAWGLGAGGLGGAARACGGFSLPQDEATELLEQLQCTHTHTRLVYTFLLLSANSYSNLDSFINHHISSSLL